MRTTAPAPLRIRILMGGRVSLWNTPNLSYIVKTFSCVCTCVFMHVLWFYANSSICAHLIVVIICWSCECVCGKGCSQVICLLRLQFCLFGNTSRAAGLKTPGQQKHKRAEALSTHFTILTSAFTNLSLTHSLTHTHTHTRTHARTRARTHTHTHTHTHVGFYGLRGLSIGVMFFILYKLYVLLLYTYPTPKLSPHRRRFISTFPPKNAHCMIYKHFKLWGHWKCPHKSPSPCNTYVIPMSLYKFVSS